MNQIKDNSAAYPAPVFKVLEGGFKIENSPGKLLNSDKPPEIIYNVSRNVSAKNNEETAMDAEKYFEILRKDREESERRTQLAEERIRQERQESDTRYEARRVDFENRMDARFDRMESKIDSAITDIHETKKEIRGLNYATIAMALATILGIGAMVIAVVYKG